MIFRDVHPALTRYLRVRAPERHEDISSDVWLEITRGIQRFHGDEPSFRAWVFTIARNKVIDAARYAARRPTVPLDAAEYVTPGVVRDVAEGYEELESMRAALALVGMLSPDQADVILLRVVAELDTQQVAELLDKSPGAVRVLAHRGLRRLAVLMADEKSERGVTS